MITDLFCHTCNIIRTTAGDPDEYGIPGDSSITEVKDVACRYIRPKGSIRILESGVHVFKQPALLLPPGTDVQEEDEIVVNLSDPGIASKYRAGPVHPAYDDHVLHHIRVDLEVVK